MLPHFIDCVLQQNMPVPTNELVTQEKWTKMLLEYGYQRSKLKLHPLLRRQHWQSQNGEEELLCEIFRRIGVTNCVYVEFGAADGIWHSNTAYFRDQLGWKGVGWEGDARKVKQLGDKAAQYNIHHEWITSKNINQLFEKYLPGQDSIDLLSIDIDGDDYYVWKALTVCDPRVVIIETNPGIPNDTPLTIVEGQTGCKPGEWQGYFGANLRCMVRLGEVKGYCFVGCVNFNAVFVRSDCWSRLGIPRLTEDQAVAEHFHPRHYWYEHRDQKNRQWVNPFE